MPKLTMNTTIGGKKKVSNKDMLTSKLPESINIMGQNVTVTVRALKGLYGQFDYNKLTISIHDKLSLDEALQTLFHEMLHAMIGISGQNEMLSESQEEGLVSMLELALIKYINKDALRSSQS